MFRFICYMLESAICTLNLTWVGCQTSQTKTAHIPLLSELLLALSIARDEVFLPLRLLFSHLKLNSAWEAKHTILSENEECWHWGKIVNENGALLWSYRDSAAPCCGCTIWGKQFFKLCLLLFMRPTFFSLLCFACPFWASLKDSEAPLLKWRG